MSARIIGSSEVAEILSRYGLTTYRMLDARYWACDEGYLNLVLESMSGPRPYETDFDDCDDRAEGLKVDVHRTYWLTAGIVTNDVHAFNVFVLSDGTCRFVDAGWSVGPVYVTPGTYGNFYDVSGQKVWM